MPLPSLVAMYIDGTCIGTSVAVAHTADVEPIVRVAHTWCPPCDWKGARSDVNLPLVTKASFARSGLEMTTV